MNNDSAGKKGWKSDVFLYKGVSFLYNIMANEIRRMENTPWL